MTWSVPQSPDVAMFTAGALPTTQAWRAAAVLV